MHVPARPLWLCGLSVCLCVCMGCPIGGVGESFGRDCTINAAAPPSCPIDYVCQVDQCVPVSDDGACDVPNFGGGAPSTRNELLINGADDLELANLELVGQVNGSLNIQADGVGNVITLPTMCALRRVQHVGGRTTIAETSLNDLDGLQSLTAVGAGLVIADNDNLTSLAALSSLQSVGPLQGVEAAYANIRVVVVNNQNLAQTDAAALAERFGDDVLFCGNAGGPACNGLGPLLSELIGR
jgi:hypothetical protein